MTEPLQVGQRVIFSEAPELAEIGIVRGHSRVGREKCNATR